MPDKKLFPKFIDPLSDFGFKFLFGNEANKKMLIAFLNELFEGRKRIIDLFYNKNENHGPQNNFRLVIYDLTCTSQNGEQFIIEVQRINQHHFKDRMVYYTAAHIHGLAPKGSNDWDYGLKEVYLMGIMDFCFEDSDPQSCIHRVQLTYQSTGEVFYDKLEYLFIEVPKFDKAEDELQTDLDRWLFALKHMSNLQKIPVYLNKGIFKELFTVAAIAKLSKEDYMNYHDRVLIAKWDQYAQKKWIKEEGIKEGIEEGMKRGRELEKENFVKNLLADGELSINKIAKLAGVTEDFVHQVKNKMK